MCILTSDLNCGALWPAGYHVWHRGRWHQGWRCHGWNASWQVWCCGRLWLLQGKSLGSTIECFLEGSLKGTSFLKTCLVQQVEIKIKPNIKVFISKCSIDFISNLENGLFMWWLAGLNVQNAVKCQSSRDAYQGLFAVWPWVIQGSIMCGAVRKELIRFLSFKSLLWTCLPIWLKMFLIKDVFRRGALLRRVPLYEIPLQIEYFRSPCIQLLVFLQQSCVNLLSPVALQAVQLSQPEDLCHLQFSMHGASFSKLYL